MIVYGQRIKQARILADLTQDQLADKVGISQSMIARIENDDVNPSSDVLHTIAKETEVKETFFEQVPMQGTTISSLAYRARASVSADECDIANEYVKLCIEQFMRMAPGLELPDLNMPKSSLDPIAAARLQRIIFGIQTTKPIVHLVNVMERNGLLLIAIPYDLENLDAFSCWCTDIDRPILAITTQKPGDRLRFSMAHELGHIVLHKGILKRAPELENQADMFAAEFLLPEAAMRSTLSPDLNLTQAAKLKLRWGVSMQAIIVRAHKLQIITDRRYHYLFEQIGRMGWKKKEPDNLNIPVEKPRSFKKMAELLYGANEFEKFASAMHIEYRMAEKILRDYELNIPQVSLADTGEYISSKQNLNPN